MSNNNDSVYTDLARGLAQCAKDSVNMPSPGADKNAQEQQRDAAARSLADPIYEAIKRGLHGVLFFSVDELNKIDKPLDDILYVCNDAGFLFRGLGNAQLSVTRNTFLRWNGYWELVQFSVTTIINNETGGNVSQEIENHNNAVDSHPDIRQDILDEKESRESADSSLQQQIDTITSKSDVVDVVASYAELVAYDTSALGDNDVVKVLADEMHDDAESYYRWDITTETWGYIGSQGPFVTPAEMLTALDGKVDKVAGKGLSTNDFTDAAKSITDNIFLATYNSTSYDDIKAAYDAGKTILCHFTDSRHTVRVATFDRLTHSTTSTSYAYFASVTKTDAYELVASKTRYGTTTTWSGTAKSWGALAEKSNVTNADISGTISDSHIASASTWNGKADKVSNATSGNLAGLDSNGNLTDSGISPSDIASDIFIAEYGITSYYDVLNAINSGKSVFCKTKGLNSNDVSAVLPFACNRHNTIVFANASERNSTTHEYIKALCILDGVDLSTGWSLAIDVLCLSSHASATNVHGVGSETNFGHVQLTGSVTQGSTKAVTSGAVYTALEGISDDIEGKQDELGDNSLAFINKSSSGDATKFLNEQGNFVSVDGIPVQKIVIGQTLQRRRDCLYSYGSVNELYVMTGWVERRQSGAAYEMILRSINTDISVYMKVIITEQFVVYTVSGINGFLYNIWNLQDSINTDVVIVTYKQGVINPSFDVLINAVHNRRDVLLVAYTADGEEQEYYHLQWWKLYSSDNVYDFHFALYDESAHRFKSYRFSYNTGGSLINAVGEVFSPISSVGTNNIETGAVTTAKIANGSVTNGKIANGAVSTVKIADQAVTNAEIANGAVGTTKLADNAVTSPKIADGAIDARHKYTALCEWTRDSQYSSSSLKVTICGGPSRGGSSTTSTNKLSFILLNYGESMIFVNNTYNGTTEIYCEVENLPKFSWLHFIICATNTTSSHKVSIVFRTNSNTTLGYYIKGRVSGSNSNYTYTLDAGECADFYLLRGEDTNGKCTLFLQRTWVAEG